MQIQPIFFHLDCRSGYYWINCSRTCQYPYYGLKCGQKCSCEKKTLVILGEYVKVVSISMSFTVDSDLCTNVYVVHM